MCSIVFADFLSYLSRSYLSYPIFFFFNATATTDIYTLSLHDALPIYCASLTSSSPPNTRTSAPTSGARRRTSWRCRSEEHTSELQSQSNLVCRLLLEKKKRKIKLKKNNLRRNLLRQKIIKTLKQ